MSHHLEKAIAAAAAAVAPLLQVDQAVDALDKAAAESTAAIRELLRRIEPVLAPKMIITGSGMVNGQDLTVGPFVIGGKAPLAAALESKRSGIAAITKEVQDAIAALQI